MAEKEYIERELVETFLEESAAGFTGTPLFVDLLLQCRDGVKRMPAADVVEVRHGEWEFRNDGRYGQTRCYCSACGKHSGIGGIRENQMKPYCPNCGAKMDGGTR